MKKTLPVLLIAVMLCGLIGCTARPMIDTEDAAPASTTAETAELTEAETAAETTETAAETTEAPAQAAFLQLPDGREIAAF